jgi:hypothetical protein
MDIAVWQVFARAALIHPGPSSRLDKSEVARRIIRAVGWHWLFQSRAKD